MTRTPARTPAQRGGAAEAVRHLLTNLSTSLGRLVTDRGDPADQVRYRTAERAAEEIAERLARHEAAHGPILNLDRLMLGGTLTDNPRKR